MIVAYDGTDYSGWQFQNHCPSVAQVLQKTFKHVFNQEIKIIAASRTDAGVHALGQVLMFNTDLVITPSKLKHAWNNVLPPAVLIRSLEPAKENFHPQRNVVQKTYCYHFFQKRPLPLASRYGYYYRYPVDMEKLQQALNVFIGTYDFRSFCTGDERENTVRRIDEARVYKLSRFSVYRIEIKGPGFLRYMIRRIVGACLEVASSEDKPVSLLSEAIDKKNPEQKLPNAPAHGLLLYKIIYKSE